MPALEERVWKLEAGLATQAKELAEVLTELEAERAERVRLENRMDYYDRMVLKWGWFVMGVLFVGTVIAAGVDKIKERIITWFLG